jgi:hypothetical protein
MPSAFLRVADGTIQENERISSSAFGDVEMRPASQPRKAVDIARRSANVFGSKL